MSWSRSLRHPLVRSRELAGTYGPRACARLFDSTLWRLSPRSRAICLTFDDGPDPYGTPALLEVLAEHQIKAVFFLIGQRAARYPRLVERLVSEGHTLGNHTYSHCDAWRVSAPQLIRELKRTLQIIQEHSGTTPGWTRPPYGHLTLPLIRWSRKRQCRPMMWDLVPPDYQPGIERRNVQADLLRFVRPGSIVCLHDNEASRNITAAMLKETIPSLRENGYEFVVPKCEVAPGVEAGLSAG